jgi:hypothetical protein
LQRIGAFGQSNRVSGNGTTLLARFAYNNAGVARPGRRERQRQARSLAY